MKDERGERVTETELGTLKEYFNVKFDAISEKIDSHLLRMDEDRKGYEKRLTELYTSRNDHQDRLTKLETGIKVIVVVFSLLIGLIGSGLIIKF